MYVLFLVACGLVGWFGCGMFLKRREQRHLAIREADKALAEATAGQAKCPACGSRCETLEECFANMEARAEEEVSGARCEKCGELMRDTNDPETKYCGACCIFLEGTRGGTNVSCDPTGMVCLKRGGKDVVMTTEMYHSLTRPVVHYVDVGGMSPREVREAIDLRRNPIGAIENEDYFIPVKERDA